MNSALAPLRHLGSREQQQHQEEGFGEAAPSGVSLQATVSGAVSSAQATKAIRTGASSKCWFAYDAKGRHTILVLQRPITWKVSNSMAKEWLQPEPSYSTFMGGGEQALKFYANTIKNPQVNDSVPSPSQTALECSTRQNSTGYWEARVVSIEFIPPSQSGISPAAAAWQSMDLQQRLQSISERLVEPLFKQQLSSIFSEHPFFTPAETEASQASFILLAPFPGPFPEPFVWSSHTALWQCGRGLQTAQQTSVMAAANCILNLYAQNKEEGSALRIVRNGPWFEALKTLHRDRNSRSDFYFIASSPTLPDRLVAILELRPLNSLTFHVYALEYLQKRFDRDSRNADEADEFTDSARPWESSESAMKLGDQIFEKINKSGAPVFILSDGFQIFVIERFEGDGIKLKIHRVVLGQPGPQSSLEPTDQQALALRARWSLCYQWSLPCVLALVAIMADEINQKYEPAEVVSLHPSLNVNEESEEEEDDKDECQNEEHDSGGSYLQKRSAPQSGSPQKRAFRDVLTRGASTPHLDASSSAPSKRQILFRQRSPFANGGTSEVRYAGLVPNGEFCDQLQYFMPGNFHRCKDPAHTRVICKAPNKSKIREKLGSGEAELLDSLAEEARVFRAMPSLQGSTLPRFYGKFKTHEGFGCVYEDVGTDLGSTHAEYIGMTPSEKEGLFSRYSAQLESLHQAGYAHADITARNPCVSLAAVEDVPDLYSACSATSMPQSPELNISLDPERLAHVPRRRQPPLAPPNDLSVASSDCTDCTRQVAPSVRCVTCRIIDLSHAVKLSLLPETKQTQLKARDYEMLKNVFARLEQEPWWRSES